MFQHTNAFAESFKNPLQKKSHMNAQPHQPHPHNARAVHQKQVNNQFHHNHVNRYELHKFVYGNQAVHQGLFAQPHQAHGVFHQY